MARSVGVVVVVVGVVVVIDVNIIAGDVGVVGIGVVVVVFVVVVDQVLLYRHVKPRQAIPATPATLATRLATQELPGFIVH